LEKESAVRNRILSATVLACFLGASLAMADVTLTQRKAARAEKKAARMQARATRPPKQDAKVGAKAAKRRARTERANGALATGSIGLIDSSGLKWFMDTNITFSTSSSASGAMSEASYTTSVTATTSLGGTTDSTLDDAYDGYQAMCVSLTGATGPCETGNADYIFYNQTGAPPTADAACGNRQYIFPTKLAGGVQMQRKVYVPSTDSFARWLNIFTNTTGAPITFNMITGNNLGSDSNTTIVTSSNGNNTAEVADTWLTSFEAYSGNTSSDVRLGHVFQGPGGSIGLTGINFVDGDDNPYWSYTITLAPGQTKTIMNYGVGQPTNAASAAKAAQLVLLASPASLACMSAVEASQVANFNAQVVVVPTVGPVGLALLGLALAGIGFVVVRRLI
jgi:hypothetical protein